LTIPLTCPRSNIPKSELKNQRDDLRRYKRFLPTLELKKQQLQIEVRKLNVALEASRAEEAGLRAELDGWVRLFAEPFELSALLRLKEVRRGAGNIAGVAIPILQEVFLSARRWTCSRLRPGWTTAWPCWSA